MQDDDIRFEAKLRTIPEITNQKRIFLIGSSQTRVDFDMEYLNRKSKKTNTIFYNLGVSGAAQPIEIFMLKDRLLEKKPDVIIYMPFVASFYSEYTFSTMKHYFNPAILPYLVKYAGIKNLKIHKDDFVDSFLGEFCIFCKYRESTRRIFRNYASGRIYAEEERKIVKHGYEKNKPKAYFINEIEKSDGNRYNTTPYTKLNENLFILFAEDLISRGVKLIVMSGPTHPLMKECYKRKIDTVYNNFLSEQAGRIGFIYLSQNQLPSFREEEFRDFTHLNAFGRDKLSKFLEFYLLKNHYLLENN
jgi:hypothetical protein